MLAFLNRGRLWTGLRGRPTHQHGSPVFSTPPESNRWEYTLDDHPPSAARTGHPRGASEPLYVVVYDISDVRRLRRVAEHCENFGVRVQYSLFECRLPPAEFERFWKELQELIEPRSDRLVVYQLCEHCVGNVRSAGCMARPQWEKWKP
jgi:CRISPR-associated protein Cas2